MKKLTKHQRYYRKRKAAGRRDFKRIQKEDGRTGVRVTRRQLCVRVSAEAAERLKASAEKYKLTKQDMLTRMILIGLPRYASPSSSTSITSRYDWPAKLLEPQDRAVRYKGAAGERQLNLAISSTARKKLECHKTATKLSLARIVQSLILNYRFLSDARRAQNSVPSEPEGKPKKEQRPQDRSHQPKSERKAWELRHGEWRLRPGLTLDHLSTDELEEYTQLVEANIQRIKNQQEERLKLRETISLPPLDEATLEAIREDYLRRKEGAP
ncbi:hypothetical protein [Vulcanococcus limneticus]|uniref:hypothetical protein n=1 Tax=Vulcanococcus limneticus TaxID=2170428 RepID=UPI00398C244F